jgi:hypothetical protein
MSFCPTYASRKDHMAELPQWIEIVNKLATPAIAGVSALYIYLQYRRSVWLKKKDLGANVLSRLENDEELAFACRALDWGIGPLIVPVQYRPLLCPRDRETSSADINPVVEHNTWSLYLALRPRLHRETLNDPRGLIYRYCFDKLFAHIDDTHRLLRQGQLLLEDLHGLEYWVKRMSEYRHLPKDRSGNPVRPNDFFQPFIAQYGYFGVASLGRELGVEDWSTVDECRAKTWIETAVLAEKIE